MFVVPFYVISYGIAGRHACGQQNIVEAAKVSKWRALEGMRHIPVFFIYFLKGSLVLSSYGVLLVVENIFTSESKRVLCYFPSFR